MPCHTSHNEYGTIGGPCQVFPLAGPCWRVPRWLEPEQRRRAANEGRTREKVLFVLCLVPRPAEAGFHDKGSYTCRGTEAARGAFLGLYGDSGGLLYGDLQRVRVGDVEGGRLRSALPDGRWQEAQANKVWVGQ